MFLSVETKPRKKGEKKLAQLDIGIYKGGHKSVSVIHSGTKQ